MRKTFTTFLSSMAIGSCLLPVLAQEVKPTRDTSIPCGAPEYPRAALANEEEGLVKLSLLVAPDGHVLESRIDKTSGSKSLDKATVAAYSKCQFKPGTRDGKPDSLWLSMQFEFKLKQ